MRRWIRRALAGVGARAQSSRNQGWGHILGGLEELRVVAPELVAHAVGEACALPGQLCGDARPLPQFDDDRVEGFNASEAVDVGAKRVGQHACIAAVVLGTGRREAVAEAIELLRVDRVDREPLVHQALDHRSVRDLDGDWDPGGIATTLGGDPGGHPGQLLAAVLDGTSFCFDPSSLTTQT